MFAVLYGLFLMKNIIIKTYNTIPTIFTYSFMEKDDIITIAAMLTICSNMKITKYQNLMLILFLKKNYLIAGGFSFYGSNSMKLSNLFCILNNLCCDIVFCFPKISVTFNGLLLSRIFSIILSYTSNLAHATIKKNSKTNNIIPIMIISVITKLLRLNFIWTHVKKTNLYKKKMNKNIDRLNTKKVPILFRVVDCYGSIYFDGSALVFKVLFLSLF